MNEFKVNELEIENTINKAKTIIKNFIELIEKVSNKETDIFTRYIGFHRMQGLLSEFMTASDVFKRSIAIGHNIGHSLLQTKEAIDREWGERKLEEDAFFCTEEEEKLNQVRNEIADKFLEGLKKLKEYEANKEQKASENVE